MKIYPIINVLLLAGAIYGFFRGIDLIWDMWMLSLALIVLGAVMGLVRNRICVAINASLCVAGGFALWFAAVFLLVAVAVMSIATPKEQANAAIANVIYLFVLGVLAILSGCLASRRLRQYPKPVLELQ